MQILSWEPKLLELEQLLAKDDYFSRGPLPGYADATIFKLLQQKKKYPDKKCYPNFYHWYVIMKQFSSTSIEKWIKQKIYQDSQSDKMIDLMIQFLQKKQINIIKNKDFSQKNQRSLENNQNISLVVETPSKQSPSKSFSHKLYYAMIITLNSVSQREAFSNKIYSLRITIKELKFIPDGHMVFLRFLASGNLIQTYKNEIRSWPQVSAIHCKRLTPQVPKCPARPIKTLSCRG